MDRKAPLHPALHWCHRMLGLALSVVVAASPASQHVRLELPGGAVHVFTVGRPRQTVLYVHGYYTDVDAAWSEHRLATQFRESGVEAVFIVPEAPDGNDAPVAFPDLDALLSQVEAELGALPHPVIALGHSGACRTLSSWTQSDALSALALLDAFYLPPDVWQRWLEADDARRLWIVSGSTAERAQPFCERAGTRVDCETTPLSHMEIVTSGDVVPRLISTLSAAAD